MQHFAWLDLFWTGSLVCQFFEKSHVRDLSCCAVLFSGLERQVFLGFLLYNNFMTSGLSWLRFLHETQVIKLPRAVDPQADDLWAGVPAVGLQVCLMFWVLVLLISNLVLMIYKLVLLISKLVLLISNLMWMMVCHIDPANSPWLEEDIRDILKVFFSMEVLSVISIHLDGACRFYMTGSSRLCGI